MNKKKFIIGFANHNYEEVWALSLREAQIKAQARQIEKGNSYEIVF